MLNQFLCLLFLPALLYIVGCDINSSNPCDDVDPVPTMVAIVNVSDAEHYRFEGTTGNNSLYKPVRETDVGIPANEYIISVNTEYIITNPDVSCRGSGLASESILSDIQIVSDADLTDATPAGSSLGSSFRFVSDGLFDTPGSQSRQIRSSALLEQNAPFLQDYILFAAPRDEPAPLTITLLLDASVEQTREHAFSVTYMLKNGDVFTLTTKPVLLEPEASALE